LLTAVEVVDIFKETKSPLPKKKIEMLEVIGSTPA
jgi:hypothetical protein